MILLIVLILYTVYGIIVEKFSSEDVSDHNSNNDIFIRKSIDLDLIENNSYLFRNNNNVVNTSSVKEFKYLGPTWKNEFDYSNSEVLKTEYKRDQLLEHIRDLDYTNMYKTHINVNNSTFCGGTSNKCNSAVDCCGGSSCIDGKCAF
jgi:hypothetical protein